jgi:hypothetical protein
MSFGNRTAQAILNALFGRTSNFGALASAPDIYVGLSSTAPAEDGTNITEPSTGSYARVATIAADWANATLADPSSIENAEDIDFAQADADWLAGADLTHAVLFDAATDGNYIGSGALVQDKPVLDGDTAKIVAGALVVTLD